LKQLKNHLLAVVMLGALSMQPSWSEEPSPGSNEPGAASSAAKKGGPNQGADGASGKPIKGNSADDGKGPKGEHSASPKGGINADPKNVSSDNVKGVTGHGAHVGTKDSGVGVNPIDTRISVQSGRTAKRPNKIGDLKTTVRPGAAGNLRLYQQNSAASAFGGVTRNAIGLPVRNNPAAQGPSAFQKGSSPVPEISGSSAIGGVARNAVGNPTDAGTQVNGPRVQQQQAIPIATVAAINYATINGTKTARRGSGPGIVGGPAKNIAGINGTGIRPKH
jgi:hypothetical protein